MPDVEVQLVGTSAQKLRARGLLPSRAVEVEGAGILIDARRLRDANGTSPSFEIPSDRVVLELHEPDEGPPTGPVDGPPAAPGPRGFSVAATSEALAAALPLAASLHTARHGEVPPAAAIRERDQLSALLDALPFPLWRRDSKDVCTYANRAARDRWPRILGRDPTRTPIPEGQRRRWSDNHARARRGETVVSEVLARDGRARSSLVFPILSGAGTETVGVLLDLTEHRELRSRVDARDEILRVLFEHAPFAIGVRRVEDGDIRHVADNPVAARLFGTTPSVLLGRTERELGIPQEVIDRTIAYMAQAKASARPIDFRLDARLDGQDRLFAGKLAHVSELGPGDHYAFVAEDQTDLEALKSHLIHAERLASLGTMAASISHEIANPASFVVMNLQLAIEDLERLSAQHPEIEQADLVPLLRASLDGVRRMARIVGDLRQLARPDGSGADREDLNRIVDSVLGLMAAQLRHHTRVTLELAELPPVRANGLRLGQVVLNLLKNAAEALPDRPREENLITVRTRHVAPWVELEIVDNGPGLPEAVAANLFRAFSASRTGGSGLGLYVCKQIVQSSGGDITLESLEGGGVRATVRLPVAEP